MSRTRIYALDSARSRGEVFLAAILSAVLPLAGAAAGSEPAPTFAKDVLPIFTKYCTGCHRAEDTSGGLVLESLDTLQNGGEHGPVLVPGNSRESRMIRMLTGQIEPKMPPEDEPAPKDEEIAMIARWIDAGALGPDGQQPVRQPLVTPGLPPSIAAKPITALACAPDGRLVAIGRYQTVELVTWDGLRHVAYLTGHPGKINGLCFTADGTTLVVATGIAGLYGEAWLWDTKTLAPRHRITAHRDVLYCAVPAPGGSRLLATAGYDGQITLWDIDSGARQRTLDGHHGAIYDLAFSPDGQILASASADATIKLWRVESGERLDTLSQPLKEQYSVDISPCGQFVIAAGEDNRIRKWQLVSHQRPQINPILISRFAHERGIQRVRYSGDGRFVVSLSADQTIKLWDAPQLQQLAAFDQQPASTQAVAFRPDGHEFLVARMDGSLERYSTAVSESREALNATVRSGAQVTHAEGREEPGFVGDEVEPNDDPQHAQRIQLPARVRGTIAAPPASAPDSDLFRFAARAGESWVFAVKAARAGSPLDSHLEVLTADGQPICRVLLQAVRDSYFTFRGKDSYQTGDFRLHNWREMRLNQFLYASGEVVKLYYYPRGPDSGFNVYPNFGQRYGYFDTTPLAHALNEPCYIVEPYAPETQLEPNGLPVFTINYENDDESRRRWGKDSRLTFTAPADGQYLLRLCDVRGLQGQEYRYELTGQAPKPDFEVTIQGTDPQVAPGAGRKFGIELNRWDDFEGEVRIDIDGLPLGFSVTTPILVQAGQLRAWGVVTAAPDAPAVTEEQSRMSRITATAVIQGQTVTREVGSLGKITLAPPAKVRVSLEPDPQAGRPVEPGVIEIAPGTTTTAIVRIVRQGHDDRVAFGAEEAVLNMPHGAYVDNIGLNGVLIPEGHTERQIFLTCEPWVRPTERQVFIEAAIDGNPTSMPIVLRVVKPQTPGS